MDDLHDDRCASLQGHPCNCAVAVLAEMYPSEGPDPVLLRQAQEELRRIQREVAAANRWPPA
jgi:hypothetical protein